MAGADTPLIGIVAGETSGDLLGAHLVRALQQRMPGARFTGIAGPRMRAAGVEALYPMESLGVRGYAEVIRHLPRILRMRSNLADMLVRRNPAVFIGVDAPDFNLTLEGRLKRHGIPTVQYVSPAIWAWRRGRIGKIRRSASLILALFPFEQPLYEAEGVPVRYVGHPLADLLEKLPAQADVREELRLRAGVPIIALLPGSRADEVRHHARLFIDAARLVREALPETRFVVPIASAETRKIFEEALYSTDEDPEDQPFTLMIGHSLEAMSAADVVLVASGTATLEAALLKRPMVIAYRMPRLSWWIMNRRRYLPWVGLPNIMAREFVVPEFLQDDATPANLAAPLIDFLRDAAKREHIGERFETLRNDLRRDTATRAADAVIELIRGRS